MEKPIKVEIEIYEIKKDKKELKIKQKINTFTMNFVYMLAGCLAPMDADAAIGPSIPDDTGTDRPLYFQGTVDETVTPPLYLAFNTDTKALPTYIAIGKSGVGATRDDYKLGDEAARELASYTRVDATIIFSASFTLTVDTIIREIGLFKGWRCRTDAEMYKFLILRGVIAEFTMYAGTTYSVEVKITPS